MAVARMFKLMSNELSRAPIRVGDAGGDYRWMSQGLSAAAFGNPSIPPRLSDVDELDEFQRIGDSAQVRSFPIEIQIKDTTTTGLAAKLKTLLEMVSSLNDWGGNIRYRAAGMSNSIELVLLDVSVANDSGVWSHEAESNFRQTITLQFTVQPWAYPDPLRVIDTFTSDTLGVGGIYNDDGADYSTVASMALAAAPISNLAVSGGRLTHVANPATEIRLTHTGTKWSYTDPFVKMSAYYGELAATKIGVILKWVDKDNYIEAYLATATTYKIDVILAGVRTNRVSSAFALTRHTLQYVCSMRGNTIFGQLPQQDTGTETTDAAQQYVLTTAEAAALGVGISGRCGMVFTPGAGNTGVEVREFEAADGTLVPCRTFSGAVDSPDNEWSTVAIPTSGSTVFSLHATQMSAMNGYFGWWNRSRSQNYCNIQTYFLFTNAIQAGVQAVAGTATGSQAFSSAKNTGGQALLLGASAAADAGGNLFLGGRLYRKGITYRARVRVRNISGAGSIVLKLGVSGDIATSAPVTPTTTAWTVVTVDWTPTATRYGCYMAMTTNGTQTIQWASSEYAVWDTTNSPTVPNPSAGGFLPYGKIGAMGAQTGYTGFVTQADANAYGGGPMLRLAAAVTGGSVGFNICSEPIDEASGECMVDLFAVLKLSTDLTSLLIQASLSFSNPYAIGFYGNAYLEPYGIGGKSVPTTTTTARKYVYLGRYSIPSGNNSAVTLNLGFTKSSAGTVDLDFLMGMPARSCIAPPSGVDDGLSLNGTPIVIKPNLIATDKLTGFVGASRWGGSALTLPRGARIECCTMQPSAGADNPNPARGSGTTLSNEIFSARMEIQPRTYLLEGMS